MTFKSPNRWVICFLGSLKQIRNFDGITGVSSINLLLVCLTNEIIEPDQLSVLKELVGQTLEGGLVVLRHSPADEMGLEKQLDKALRRVKANFQNYPSKRIPLIQEEIRF